MVASTVEYALMAGAAYESTRDRINRIPGPEGWAPLDPASGLDHRSDTISGFEAAAFVNAGGEIVISFAGTYDKSIADKAADAALFAGVLDTQLLLAAKYYQDIKRAYPDVLISFTGHSLGGGLAALMGVFFDKPAITYDQAPFRAAASMTNAIALQAYLIASDYSLDTDLLTFFAASIGPARIMRGEQKVSIHAVAGEFLSVSASDSSRIGYSRSFIQHGAMSEDSMNVLHSQALLIALKHSESLRQATYQLPFLVHDIFDKSLFARDTGPENTDQRDLLTHLIRREFGVPGVAGSDADLLAQFAADMARLGAFGNAEESLRRPLEHMAMHHYYNTVTGSGRELLEGVSGGLRIDLTKPVGDTEISAQDLIAQVRGYDALLGWIMQNVPEDARADVAAFLAENSRITLPLNSTLNASSPEDETRDFMLAGTSGGQLSGGGGKGLLVGRAGKDVLLGGAGDDRLRGGRGAADYMVGGAGDDTYIYKSEDQADLIYDEDGQGHIEYDGMTLAGGKGKGKNSRVFFDNPDAPDTTYVVSGDMTTGPVTLTIKRAKGDGQLTVFDFYDGDLGIHLEDGEDQPPKAPRPPAPQENSGNQSRGDPLVIDLAGTGISTYGLEQDLRFDHDGDGFAESTGWIAPGSGVLVLDADADNVLDDGQELFGDFTRLPGGQLAANGFAALSQYDRNRDGIIDAQDEIWSSLKVAVWESDPRGNPVLGDPATAMSLRTLDELGITAIGLDSTIVTATDGNGNTRTRSGTLTLNDATTREIAEYRFARDNAETKFLDWRPLPADIAVLPELTLGGVQMDLTQAMVRDAGEGWRGQPPGTLRAKLDAFLNETNIAAATARFEELLFAWTGADAIAEGSFTNQLDARHARVLEQAYGRSFQNPNADQAAAWQLTYERLAEGLYASLLAQTHLAPFYEAIVWKYNEATGRAFGDLSAAQALLDAELAVDPLEGRALANEFGRLLRGLGLTRDTTYFALREHFTDNGDPALAFVFDAAGKQIQAETEGQPLGITRQLSSFTQAVRAIGSTALYGHGGDDVLYGGTGSARLVGGPGDNVLFGDAGGESLWAHEGNDVLDGGAGNDLLKGGAGDDIYIFRRGSGVDTLEEGGGVDRVFFGGGLTRADLFIRRNQAGGYEIGIAGTGDVLRLPTPGAPGGGVELFMFSDGTLLRYTDLFVPTEGDDYLFGAGGDDAIDALGGDDTVASGPGDDSLHGGQGNDLLEGEEGNDLLFGDAGDDVLIGGAGDDILDGGAGDDLLAASEEDRNAALNAWRIKAGRGNGNDTYRFGFGDGHDTIVDSDRRSDNMDTIVLKAGVTPADVQMAADGVDMVLRLSSGESLRVKKHYSEDGYNAIERILFADGTVWSGNMLLAPTVIGTPEDDRLNALSYRSTHVIGLDGNDVLYGGKKDDLLEGGGGDDWLLGLDGDDVLRGGMGNDHLEDGAGSDVYDGGAGNDQLREADSTSLHSPGADVFLFGRGDGQDTLVSRRIYAYDWWMAPPPEQYGASEVVDDVVRFMAGVNPDDIAVTGVRTQGVRNNWSADARIEIAGDPGSSLRIEGFLNGYNEGTAFKSTVKRFEFADGTVWNFEDIVSRLVWHGTPGDDASLWGSEYDDHIFGYGGDDMISGLWGNDTIEAGDGDDIIHSGNGHSVVFGGDGNDWIDPGDGNDVVDGGAGDDVVSSRYAPWLLYWRNRSPVLREGDLTVMFGHGDGHDVVEITNQRADSNDVIRMKAEVAPDDVKLVRIDNDLVLRLPDSGDSMTVRNWFSSVTDVEGTISNPFRVEGILFEDGTHWGVDEIRAGVLIGTEAEEEILGYAGSDDLIEGRAGNDILRGDTGDDTYVFRAGDGRDTIIDAAGADKVRFADRLPGDIRARRIDGNLVLDAGDDRITIRNWFAPTTGGVQAVQFSDGSEWDAARLRELVLTGTPGDDIITGYETDDTLAGLAGADVLAGGIGNDSYVYRRGDGRDIIRETGGQDALMLMDLLPGEVTLRAEGMDLVVAVSAPPGEEETDVIRVVDWFARNAAMVERIVFAEGSELDAEAIRNAANLVTDTDDFLLGTPDNDLIDGKGGNDTILGLDGDDIIRGGTGNDNLQGGTGANEYLMGRGDGFDAIRTTPTRTNVFPGFLEQADLELNQLESGGGIFQSDFWANESYQGDFYRIPWEIRETLMELSVGVSTEVARDALTAMRTWLAGGSDTIILGEGISIADLSVQYGVEYVGGGYEWEGYESPVLAVGFGRDEGFRVTTEQVLDTGEGGGNYAGELSLKRIRFADGSELSLDDLIAMADMGVIGEQYGTWWDDVLVGSVAPDVIYGDGGSDRIDARGQNDIVNGGEGDDVIFGGTGDDVLYGSWDSDLLAGGGGADQLSGDYGDDVYAFNRGDGTDRIDNWPGMLSGDNDAISFGGGILETDISAYVTPEGRLMLQTGAEGDSLVLDWFDVSSGFSAKPQQTISLAQFIHPDGTVRVYDFAQLVTDLRDGLLGADADNPLPLFGDATDYDVTPDWIGDGEPLGGNPALAYALLGDPFAEPQAIYAEAGDDVIVGTALGDTIDAGDGNNFIDAGSGNDEVITGSGNDTIAAGAGADVIYAGEGDDVITGGDGNDFIDAGPGNDRAAGGAGDDYYYFYRGYGSLAIDDLAEPDAGNTLYLDEISPSDLTSSAANGELVLRVADDGGEIRLSNFNPADPYASHAVERYEFSDGTVLTYEELLQQGLYLAGTESSEFLVGAGGDDTITGNGGNDLIAGGWGNDALEGGLGSDTYVFNLGDGEDTLIDRETFIDRNVIQFGPGIDSSQVRIWVEAGDLFLGYGDEGDTIRMPGVRPGDPASGGVPFNLMRFDDGSTLQLSDLVARGLEIIGTALEDEMNGAIGDDVLYGKAGRDLLAGGPGSDTYYLSPGSGFDVISDVSNATQSNTLILDFPDLASLDDLTTAYDPAASTLTIRVSGTEDGAVLTGFNASDPLGSRVIDSIVFARSGQTFAFAQLIANGIEVVGTPDNDVIEGTSGRDIIRGLEGDDLIVGGTGSDIAEGGPGDDAYVFQRGDGVLTIREETSRSPGNTLIFGEGIAVADIRNNLRFIAPDETTGAPGWLRIGIASADGAVDEVRIEGFDPNDAEVGEHGVESFLFEDGTLLSYRDLVLNTFIVQGDVWDDSLTGTNVQDRLYGYEGNDELRAGDGNDTLTGGPGDDLLEGGAGADMYVFNRGDGNDVLVDSTAGYDASMLAFGAGIGPDDIVFRREGDDLLIEYGPGDSVRIGNWAAERAGLWALRFGDGDATTIEAALNAAPVVEAPLDGQVALEDQPFFYALPAVAFVDPEGSGLTYGAALANGNALPNWLAFNPQTRSFSGTPENIDVGTLDVVVSASDALGATSGQPLRITVENTNDDPEVAAAVPDRQATEDELFAFTVPADAFRDVDADDALSYSASLDSGSPLPAWLTFDPDTRSFSGTPANEDVGSIALRLSAIDLAGAQAQQTFVLSVANVNDAPAVGVPLADRSVRHGEAVSWQLPEGAFTDVDAGDVLSYSARLADDNALPDWLSCDAATGAFSGTQAEIGRYDIRVTATDLAGAAASQTFALDVTAAGNQPPLAEPDAAGVTEDCNLIAWGNVLANDHDPEGDPLTVADPGIRRGEYGRLALLPNGAYAYLLDDCSSRVQGLGAGETAVERFSYLASDGEMQSVGELAVTIQGTNDVPVLAAPLANVQLAKGAAFSWQLPIGSFTDRDRNDTLSYTATLANGRPLPAWLAFDAATQAFSGTAPAHTKGTFDVRVVASDSHGEGSIASDVFRISVGNKTILPKGNAGVGNGMDSPPPGHHHEWNDGPGTGPGRPGRRGGEAEHAGHEDWVQSRSGSGGQGKFACLDAHIVARWCRGFGDDRRDMEARGNGDVLRRWEKMERELAQLLDGGNRPSWMEPVHGADLRGLALISHAWQSPMRGGADPISLAAGTDMAPKSFHGLPEGFARLG